MCTVIICVLYLSISVIIGKWIWKTCFFFSLCINSFFLIISYYALFFLANNLTLEYCLIYRCLECDTIKTVICHHYFVPLLLQNFCIQFQATITTKFIEIPMQHLWWLISQNKGGKKVKIWIIFRLYRISSGLMSVSAIIIVAGIVIVVRRCHQRQCRRHCRRMQFSLLWCYVCVYSGNENYQFFTLYNHFRYPSIPFVHCTLRILLSVSTRKKKA